MGGYLKISCTIFFTYSMLYSCICVTLSTIFSYYLFKTITYSSFKTITQSFKTIT